jgi:hypothetical protein
MKGKAEDACERARFDHLAEVHHRDHIADVADHGEIVTDKDIGEGQLVLEADQEVHDLCTDRDVESRGRLVENENPGLHGQGSGDRYALCLSAGELVRITIPETSAEGHHLEQLVDAHLALRAARDELSVST